jgi:hypothetical protein
VSLRRGELPEDDREDPSPPKVVSAVLRALLEGIVDYAGLFPPASLDVTSAVRNYASYRAGTDRWMLGRFVVGIAKLPELRSTIGTVRKKDDAWPLSVVAPDAAAATSVLRGIDDANARIESVEVRATTPAEVLLISRAAPKTREVYVEVPLDASTPAMLDAIVTGKLRAKIRTGGVTEGAFPQADEIVAFMRACIDRNLPFKATAGLHHPLRGSYRLTYDGPAQGPMYGYLNVFLAAAFMRQGVSDLEAAELLVESDPAAIVVEDQAIRWRDKSVDTDAARTLRARVATSFGSCSFREPVDELPYPVSSKAPA